MSPENKVYDDKTLGTVAAGKSSSASVRAGRANAEASWSISLVEYYGTSIRPLDQVGTCQLARCPHSRHPAVGRQPA